MPELLASRFTFPSLPPLRRAGGHQEPPRRWLERLRGWIQGDPQNAITGPFRINRTINRDAPIIRSGRAGRAGRPRVSNVQKSQNARERARAYRQRRKNAYQLAGAPC